MINTVIIGNCIDKLSLIQENSIDLIFADPPYFMQTEGELLRTTGERFSGVNDSWDKFASYKEYDNFCTNWLKECRRVLKDNGSIWVIGAFQNIYRIGYIMQNLGFWILNDIIWSKPNAVPNFGGTRFKNSHETMLWCTKSKKSKYTFNYKTMKHINNDKQDKSVWDIGICIGSERIKDETGKKVHNTQKPERLLYKIILSTSKIGDIVLDPFFGTGTTGAMAKFLGRNYIGIEQNEKYAEIAHKRIEKVTFADTDLHRLALETKPPRIDIKKLMPIDTPLYTKQGEFIGRINDKGYVDDGENILSIHKMAAKRLNKLNYNGWDFFYIMQGDGLKSINDLRYEYVSINKYFI